MLVVVNDRPRRSSGQCGHRARAGARVRSNHYTQRPHACRERMQCGDETDTDSNAYLVIELRLVKVSQDGHISRIVRTCPTQRYSRHFDGTETQNLNDTRNSSFVRSLLFINGSSVVLYIRSHCYANVFVCIVFASQIWEAKLQSLIGVLRRCYIFALHSIP